MSVESPWLLPFKPSKHSKQQSKYIHLNSQATMADEIKPETIKKTQDALGKYIKKPPLTEKLLKKPPFRFLHDITTHVISEQGIFTNLYSVTELDSSNIKDRESKVAFLQKLIDAVKSHTGLSISARPNKIVAGLEPTKTNELLQAIAYAVENKSGTTQHKTKEDKKTVDKSVKKASIKSVASKSKLDVGKDDKSRGRSESSPRVEATRSDKKRRTVDDDVKRNRADSSPRVDSTRSEKTKSKRSVDDEAKRNRRDNSPRVDSTRSDKTKKKIVDESKQDVDKDSDEPPILEASTIPSTANETAAPTSSAEVEVIDSAGPEFQPNETTKESETTQGASASPKRSKRGSSANTSARSQQSPTKVSSAHNKHRESKGREVSKKEVRPKTSLRPPSVRPSSARPGAPRLKSELELPLEPLPTGKVQVIVESADGKDGADEEETIVLVSEESVVQALDVEEVPEDRGHLVSQILEQIETEGNAEVPRTEKVWDTKMQVHDHDAQSLRQLIQSVTRSANPLGRLMGYFQEDIEAMRSELVTWTETDRTLAVEISERRNAELEALKPLQEQLEQLRENVRRQRKLIAVSEAAVLRNEKKITELIVARQ